MSLRSASIGEHLDFAGMVAFQEWCLGVACTAAVALKLKDCLSRNIG